MPGFVLSVFTQQAYNLILLAQDEARMLGRAAVAPEHLLLALARRGNVSRLLSNKGVGGGDIHASIVRHGGLGDDLVLGSVPLAGASRLALERAVDVAGLRGETSPGGEHLLIALGQDPLVMTVLSEVGVGDAEALVDARYPARRQPLTAEQVKSYLLRVGVNQSPPQPGPGPPVFERFTDDAARAVRAAVEASTLLESGCVEPFHLLLGCLHVPESVAGRALSAGLVRSDMGTLGEAMDRACLYGPNPAHQATGIFSDTARRVVAEDALIVAHRHGHPQIGTGHLLLATLDCRDRTATRIIGEGPVSEQIAREVMLALPGAERCNGDSDRAVILFDQLITELTSRVSEVVPAGWTVRGSSRSGGLRLRAPHSRSEEDGRIDLGWTAGLPQPARPRMRAGIQRALEELQEIITRHAGEPWPAPTARPDEPVGAHAEIAGDHENPTLRMWYGDPDHPALELKPPLWLNNLISTV